MTGADWVAFALCYGLLGLVTGLACSYHGAPTKVAITGGLWWPLTLAGYLVSAHRETIRHLRERKLRQLPAARVEEEL